MEEQERDIPVKTDKVMLQGEKGERKIEFCQCRSAEWWGRCPTVEVEEGIVGTR